MLPNQIQLTTNATNKLHQLKSKTGLTPNICSRIAIMLALRESNNLSNVELGDLNGQVLHKGILFGQDIEIYDILINQYIIDNDIKLDIKKAITSLIEVGIYKMGHVKSLLDLIRL